MITFQIAIPPGLHAKPDRAAIVAEIQQALAGRFVPKRRYRTEIVLYGKWDKANGEPASRDSDNILKTLFDAMSEAFGFGKRGRGDEYLNRRGSWECVHQDGPELAVVTLWPI